MRRRAGSKRHRVVMRPQVRTRRYKQVSAALAVAVMGALAASAALHASREIPTWDELGAALFPAA